MMRRLFAFSALSVVALQSVPCRAEPNPVQGLVGFAAIAEAKTEAPIYRFDKDCPDAGEVCKTGATLPKGAILMISDPGDEGEESPPHVRFVYTPDGTKASVSGAVRWSDLASHDLPVPDIEAWKGVYYTVTNPDRGATASLSVRVTDAGQPRIAAQAILGASQSEEPPEGAPQSYFEVDFTPDGARATVEDGKGCKFAVAWLGPYLAVEEDGEPCTQDGEPGFAGLYLRDGDRPMNPASEVKPVSAAGASGYDQDTKRFMGGMYKSTSGAATTQQTCRADCEADPKCKAFQFEPGIPNETHPSCKLMDDPGTPEEAKGIVSGIVRE